MRYHSPDVMAPYSTLTPHIFMSTSEVSPYNPLLVPAVPMPPSAEEWGLPRNGRNRPWPRHWGRLTWSWPRHCTNSDVDVALALKGATWLVILSIDDTM